MRFVVPWHGLFFCSSLSTRSHAPVDDCSRRHRVVAVPVCLCRCEQELQNLGRLYKFESWVQAAAPHAQRILYRRFTDYNERTKSALDALEQLYTVSGSQGIVLSGTMKRTLGVRVPDAVVMEVEASDGTKEVGPAATGARVLCLTARW
jgi:hypothetical protein